MKKLVEILVDAPTASAAALPKLRKHEYSEIVAGARELRKIGEGGRHDLPRGDLVRCSRDSAVDAKNLIREKTVLEDLEHAVD